MARSRDSQEVVEELHTGMVMEILDQDLNLFMREDMEMAPTPV